jgi:aspartyl-tRNA synthetase
MERYFQIAPCFRDEDPRADRHAGDFYQLDLEMSFVEQEDIFNVIEPLMLQLTEKFSNKTILSKPFPRLSWHEAIGSYGSDKPDLRYDLPLTDVSDIVAKGKMEVFNKVLKDKGSVFALRVPGGAAFTRSQLGELEELARAHGAKGLAYLISKEKLSSPILKHLGEDIAAEVVRRVGATKGDLILFSAAEWERAAKLLGTMRSAVAQRLELTDNTKAAWVWVTDFPMYEYNAEEDKIDFSHNPFSMPQGGLEALEAKDPTNILGYQYDLALNGFEISSGAIRNHRPDIMYKAFAIAGYSKEQVDEKFGGMLRAFSYGAPPHGGFAPGLDRLLFILLDVPSIRDIYAFPKDGKGRDLLMNSPAPVTERQLKELHLSLDRND